MVKEGKKNISFLQILLLSLVLQGGAIFLSFTPSTTSVVEKHHYTQVRIESTVIKKMQTKPPSHSLNNPNKRSEDQKQAATPQSDKNEGERIKYLEELARQIQEEISYPLLSQRNKERGEVEVEFKLNHQAEIFDITLTAKSIFPRLNDEVIRAVKKVANKKRSLPPPALIKDQWISIIKRINFE